MAVVVLLKKNPKNVYSNYSKNTRREEPRIGYLVLSSPAKELRVMLGLLCPTAWHIRGSSINYPSNHLQWKGAAPL